MAENYGGPVWHASGCGRNLKASRRICLDALAGVGDQALGQWEHEGENPGVWHIQRRLSAAEREAFSVPEPYDIRGTDQETQLIVSVLTEAPYLAGPLGFR